MRSKIARRIAVIAIVLLVAGILLSALAAWTAYDRGVREGMVHGHCSGYEEGAEAGYGSGFAAGLLEGKLRAAQEYGCNIFAKD